MSLCPPPQALLTGIQPSRIGVYWNPDMRQVSIPDSQLLLPQALKAAGYVTALVGKWNLNQPRLNTLPPERYFDETYGQMVPDT